MKLPKMRFEVKFDDVREIVNEIAQLQKFKLSEDDDRNLVDIADVVNVLQRHVTAAPVDPDAGNKRFIDQDMCISEIRRFAGYLDEDMLLRMTIAINRLPSADVRPVKRGKWTLNKDGSGTCSECGFVQNGCWDLDNWDNFCHHCGADMREVEE